MNVIAGTSGYSYKEWKGTFYPADLPASKMLSFYAQHFNAVEINNTFYRMPTEKLVTSWASEVPDGFTFVLKAPQWITHRQDLMANGIQNFFAVAAKLGSKLGPSMFRFPPHKDGALRPRDFLGALPRGHRICLEFRDESWLDDKDVLAAMREYDAALCISDTDEVPDPDKLLISTASWGYLRLRRTHYTDKQLAAWAKRVQSQKWTDAYVFFKHEDEGKGPAFAKRFLELLRNA